MNDRSQPWRVAWKTGNEGHSSQGYAPDPKMQLLMVLPVEVVKLEEKNALKVQSR